MKKLNKNIKKIWLIYSLLILIILFLIKIILYQYIKYYFSLYKIIFLIISLAIPIIININYLRYRYSIRSNKIELSHGIILLKITIIPINKIQQIIIKQNPINKIFNLKTIKIYTIKKTYSIQGLSENEIKKISKYIENRKAGIKY